MLTWLKMLVKDKRTSLLCRDLYYETSGGCSSVVVSVVS
jgi:hypothetical protein